MNGCRADAGKVLARMLGGLIRDVSINARGEIDVWTHSANLPKVLAFLQAHPECGFSRFVGIFVRDAGEDDEKRRHFVLSYLLRGEAENSLCRIRVETEEGDMLPSASRVVSGTAWSERLAWDMFGIPFSGHPDLRAALTPRFDIGPEGNRGEEVLVVGPHHAGLDFAVSIQMRLEGEVVRHVVVHPGGSLPRLTCALEDVVPGGQGAGSAQASFFARFACARALEALGGVEIHQAVRRRRIMLAEIARILAHLQSLAEMNAVLGQDGISSRIRELHDALLPVFLRHQDGMVAGGLATTFSGEDFAILDHFCQAFPGAREALGHVPPLLRLRLAGIGEISAADALETGASGPLLRAAGEPYDLRAHDADYAGLPLRVVTGHLGDSLSRHLVRAEELDVSFAILDALLAADGETDMPFRLSPLPDVWPAGEVYEGVESAQGEVGACVFSTGNKDESLSLRLRIPTGFHLSALPAMAKGHMLDDVGVILASLGLGGGKRRS